MANVGGAGAVSYSGGMMSPKKEPLLIINELRQENVCKKQNNVEEDQLILSRVIKNSAAGSSVSPSMATPQTSGLTARKKTKLMVNKSCKKSPAHSPLMEKAKALQASLDPTHPSFIKLMLPSHATKTFWLGIPSNFSRMYLPNYDIAITLEDEKGVLYEIRFLAGGGGLSGGWRRFAQELNLQEGDILVFHLVRQYAFKVYMVRGNCLDCHAHETTLDTAVNDVAVHEEVENSIEPTSSLAQNYQKDGHAQTHNEFGGEMLNFESDKEDSTTKSMEDCSFLGSFVDLKNFSIVVDGSPVDSELSFSARVKYHELCCAQKSYLHERLPKCISHKLVVHIILETVSIFHALRDCNISTSLANLEEWDKTLGGFELMGMDVGFLLDRIRELSSLAVQYQESDKTDRYAEVIMEENNLNEEISYVEKKVRGLFEQIASLETRIAELKEAKNNVEFEKEALEAHFQNCKRTFKETAKKPF